MVLPVCSCKLYCDLSLADTTRDYTIMLPDFGTVLLPNLFFSRPIITVMGFLLRVSGKGLCNSVYYRQVGFTIQVTFPQSGTRRCPRPVYTWTGFATVAKPLWCWWRCASAYNHIISFSCSPTLDSVFCFVL